MLSFIKTPYKCSYSNNTIEFGVESNMCFEAPRVFSNLTLDFAAVPVPGTIYIIKWVNPDTLEPQQIYFVVQSSTTANGMHELPYSASYTATQFRDIFYEKLKAYKGINAWYKFEVEGSFRLILTAREASDKLIPVFNSNQGATYIIHSILKGSIEPDTRAGYQMNAVVYFERNYLSGEFEVVANLPCTVSNDGDTKIDISTVLAAEIENTWDSYPVPDVTGFAKSKGHHRYYVEFYESWSGLDDVISNKSEVHHVRWGGVSTDDESIADPMYLTSTSKGFLTWWPSGKKVAYEQNDWLSWMNAGNEENVSMQLTIVTAAGVIVDTSGPITLDTWESVTFATGGAQNDINTLAGGSEVFSWKWQLVDSHGDPISEEYTYYLDRLSGCVRHFVLFFNSFGMPETFSTFGEWQESMNISTQIASRSNYFNTTSLFPRNFVFSSKHGTQYDAVTSLLTNQEARRLQPMLNSMISFLYEGDRLIPIIISNGDTGIVDETEFTQRLPLKMLKANDSDRSSFYELVPELNILFDCGEQTVTIDKKGINTTFIGGLIVKNSSNTTIQTGVWSTGLNKFNLVGSITESGDYRAEVIVDGKSLIKHFRFDRKRITLKTTDSGAVSLLFKSSNASETIFIDWGVGNGFSSHAYTNSDTTIDYNYAGVTGEKTIIIEKVCMDDIVKFVPTFLELYDIEVSAMKNLEYLQFLGSFTGDLYLSQFQKLKNIYSQNNLMSGLAVGYQKELVVLTVSNTNITSSKLDALMKELWKYRKMYSAAVTLTLGSLGFTPSSTVNSIVNGTGVEYSGEGLQSDYGWTINIS